MPQAIPPAGSGGLPRISTRAFQLVGLGFSAWTAVNTAITEYLAALVKFVGSRVVGDIGEIGK